LKQAYIGTGNFCEEALLETQCLKNLVASRNYPPEITVTETLEHADLIVFYACGHLRQQEHESMHIIQQILGQKKPSSTLIVWGCLPKINPKALRTIYQGPLLGPQDFAFFYDFFAVSPDDHPPVFANTIDVPCIHQSRFRSPTEQMEQFYNKLVSNNVERRWLIKIVSGCKNFCTYCTDRLAYRSLHSVPVEYILKQFELGFQQHYKHFYLVGRDLGSYGHDIDQTLLDLLNHISQRYSHREFQVHLHNLAPQTLIQMIPHLDPHFLWNHVSEIGSHIQSGSRKILKLMNKPTTLQDWVTTIGQLNTQFPHIYLATSVMVGFPGETVQDHNQTLALIKHHMFDHIDVYAYNERPNLPSKRLPGQVTPAIKWKRYHEMRYYASLSCLHKRINRRQIFTPSTLPLALTTAYQGIKYVAHKMAG
jgi:tRNA A37 methylthiotransferase MiaB